MACNLKQLSTSQNFMIFLLWSTTVNLNCTTSRKRELNSRSKSWYFTEDQARLSRCGYLPNLTYFVTLLGLDLKILLPTQLQIFHTVFGGPSPGRGQSHRESPIIINRLDAIFTLSGQCTHVSLPFV